MNDRKHMTAVGDTALFLPFDGNKRRQAHASINTSKTRIESGTYSSNRAVWQSGARADKLALTLLFSPVNRRVAGSNPA
jgi:hypothetical protein